nr:MAG TPA: hypothetical protein [Caudoviricetes sp.]
MSKFTILDGSLWVSLFYSDGGSLKTLICDDALSFDMYGIEYEIIDKGDYFKIKVVNGNVINAYNALGVEDVAIIIGLY